MLLNTNLGAPAAFPASYPLSFEVSNGNLPVLYLTYASAQSLQLTIENVSSSNFAFPPQAGAPSASAYELYFSFQAGVLDNTQLVGITLAEQGWSFTIVADPSGGTDLYISNTAGTPLPPQGSFTFTLQNLFVAATANPSLTQVGLQYNLMNTDSQVPFGGTRTAFLQIVPSAPAQTTPPPFWFGCAGSNAIVNDGVTINSLSLLLANASIAEAITLTPYGNPSPTTFVLTFDTQNDGESRPWSLGNSSQIQGIGVAPPDATWTVTYDDTGLVPQWTITTTNTGLNAGSSVVFPLANIVSSMDDGPANVFLTYLNLPGFSDGQLITTIEKSPVVTQSSGVSQQIATPGTSEVMLANGVIQATNFQLANGVAVVPSGAIIMWNGSAIPEGWVICDGSNNTPNLTSLFIVAAAGPGATTNQGQPLYNVNDSAGFDVHTHALEIPPLDGGTDVEGAHAHITANPVNWVPGNDAGPGVDGVNPENVWDTANALNTDVQGAHSHSFTTTPTTTNTQPDAGNGYYNRPAYYALYFIMKL